MNNIICRSGLKKIILFVLVLAMAFGSVLAPQADAATKYKVKYWKDGYLYKYYVYTGDLPKEYEATFVRYSFDLYKSGKTKIIFYYQYDVDANDEMVKALLKKVGDDSKGKYSSNYVYYDNAYFPRIVLGWYWKTESISKLIKKSPFTNDQGYKLYIVKLGDGDVTADYKLDFDSLELEYPGCSWAVYYQKENITIGYQFEDKDGYVVDMHGEYFPYW